MFQLTHTLVGTVNPYITAAGTTIIGKAPDDAYGGGVTITEVTANARSGTATLTLVDLGPTGTVAVGTVCSLAIAQATGAPLAGAPNGYWLDGDNYLGIVYAAGTVLLPGNVVVQGRMGR